MNDQADIFRTRRVARLTAVQVVYQSIHNTASPAAALRQFIDNHDFSETGMPDRVLLTEIVRGVEDRFADIDRVLADALKDRGGKTLEPLLHSVLLCGICEVLGNSTSDAPVIINDYIDVAKAFYEGGESKLVNAVLDSVAKVVRA